MAGKKDGEGNGGDGTGGDDGEKPEYITAEELDKRLNGALSGYSKRIEKKFEELVTKALSTKAEEKPDDAPAGGKPGDEVAAKLAKMERDLAAANKRAEETEKARAEEAAQAKRQEERAALRNALHEAGITDAIQARAAQALLESDAKVVRDEDGAIRFKTADKYGVEALVDLGKGLTEWAKSEGQVFLPAKKVAGSGSKTPRTSGDGGKPDPKAQAIAEARAILRAELLGEDADD